MGFPTGGTPTTAPLPTGAATETKQDAGNTLLDTISDTLIAEAEAAPRTAFGEQSHAPSDWPLVEESFQYGVNPKDVSTIIIGAGTVTASGATSNGSDLVLALPNTAHAATIAYATKAIVYRSGSPQVAMITPSFVSGGVANSRERITLDDLNLDLSPGQSVTISVTPSANNMRTRVTLSGHEIH